jgi:branched-chain amino acid transport system ATP-binding protein
VTAAPEAAAAQGVELRFEDLCVPRGGRPVLHDVTLSIPPGAITTLLGPNGAGKSTLVLAVGGVVRATSGRVLLGDLDLTRRRPEQVRAAGVAIVPEGRRLLPRLTVEDNLRVATYSLRRAEARAGVERALQLFPELEKRWKAECRLLSGGEQQMVVLAQALVSHPKVILVDELSLGLAPVVVKRLAPALEAVAATGVGVLLIEQFAHVALGVAQTAYVLEGGRIRYEGTAQALKDDPTLLHSAYLLRGGDVPIESPGDG